MNGVGELFGREDIVDADSVVRVLGDRVFVINRFDGSSVQEVDAANGLATLWRCSVGAGSNPHDLAVVAPDKAYVSRYDATTIAIVDPSVGPSCAGFDSSGFFFAAMMFLSDG